MEKSTRSLVAVFVREESESATTGTVLKSRVGHLERVNELLAYLEQSVEDYREVSAAFTANFDRMAELTQTMVEEEGTPLTPEQVDLMKESDALGTILHLRIETFYLFAKMLLDKLGQAIESYFGQGREASLERHSKLARNLEKFAAQKGLVPPPPTLMEKIEEAGERIADYRDHYVTHPANPRMMLATGVSTETGDTWLMPFHAYPKESEAVFPPPRSESPPVLLKWIEDYVGEVLAYVVANRDRART
jgi:hypothetical protein